MFHIPVKRKGQRWDQHRYLTENLEETKLTSEGYGRFAHSSCAFNNYAIRLAARNAVLPPINCSSTPMNSVADLNIAVPLLIGVTYFTNFIGHIYQKVL